MPCPKSPKSQVLRLLVNPEFQEQLAQNVIGQTRRNTLTPFDFLHRWQQHPDLALHESGDWRLECRGRWSPTRDDDHWPTVELLVRLYASHRIGAMMSAPTMKTPCRHFWTRRWRHFVRISLKSVDSMKLIVPARVTIYCLQQCSCR